MKKRNTATRKSLQKIAQQRFGYEQLNPGQEAAIQSLLKGHDTLVVMPTGSGKSAIYQIAAFLISGSTVVVSPLLALQRNQAQAIVEQDVGEAAIVNSQVQKSEKEEAFEKLETGDLEFLFLAPEQFSNSETLERLHAAKPSLFVVDEAHCISAWGHDFRPDYMRLGAVIEALGHPRVLALTATAAPPVRDEIIERLAMQNPNTVVRGFDRPNIALAVERFEDSAEKQQALISRVSSAAKPGIVYAATRKRTEELADALRELKINACSYHAGLKKSEREAIETDFLENRIDVLVATTAFGMGVDKPNVRFVFHADISDSVDSYYQEIGRSGRDGEPSQAILFYNPKDLNLRRFFAQGGSVEAEQLEDVAEALQNQDEAIAPQELQEQVELSKAKLRTALHLLSEVDAIATEATGEISASEALVDTEKAAAAALAAQERQRQFERSRLEMVRGYAEVRDCRRKYLLNYFGEQFDAPCGSCDNCKAGVVATESERQPFPLNGQVVHKSWGKGTVMRYESDKVVVLFETVGYKTLGVKMAIFRRLLQPVEG